MSIQVHLWVMTEWRVVLICLTYLSVGTRCTLPIGYQTTPPPIKSGPYVYLNFGSVTQQQGMVPPEAFEGEHETHEALKALDDSKAGETSL